MTADQKIPLFIVEEHHEAFYVWNYCIKNNFLPSSGNCLLHIDEHSDMIASSFNKSLHNLDRLADFKEFTYNELQIANFIIPAVYLNIVNEVFWVKQKHDSNENKLLDMYLRSYNNDGKKMIFGKKESLITGEYSTSELSGFIKDFKYCKIIAPQIQQRGNLILDIDLDYFSCSGDPNKNAEIYVEITAAEYEGFVSNPYHRLRFLGFKLEAVSNNDQYYYVFNNYGAVYESPLYVSKALIKSRIHELIEVLKAIAIRPKIIDICRSRISGYTPSDQWEFIESELIAQLSTLYNLEIKTINEIL